MSFREYMQKRHAIDVMLAMLPSESFDVEGVKRYVGWKAINTRLKAQGIPCADGTYRSRCKELVELGLAEAIPLDPIKNDYVLTPKGKEVANRLAAYVKDLEVEAEK